ncbi:RE1 [Symbiodinium sp. CCMP2456]|nr:RE1 [Symbiodinium sp. CCMP2456]
MVIKANLKLPMYLKGIPSSYLKVILQVYFKLPMYLKGIPSSYLKVILKEYLKLPMYLKGMFSSYLKVVLKEYLKLPMYLKGMFSSYLKVVLKAYLKLPMYLKGIPSSYLKVVLKAYLKLLMYLEGMFSSYLKVVPFLMVLVKRRVGPSAMVLVKRRVGQQGSVPPDPMALLAGGMAQLQAVMLKQMTAAEKDKEGEKSPEAVKPGTTTLPTLPVMKVESASVDIMDWLEKLTSPMSDLSDGSGLWWEKVKASATSSYVEWAKSSPLERLKVSPPRNEELETGKWSRVNSRASSMLMLALAEGVQNEMVARRLTGSSTSILFRLMTLYQPGGEEEKVRILHNLQQPPQEGEPAKVLDALRSWERWLRRCRELEVTAPDPALLARGLNAMVKKVMEKNPEASFRTSLVKSTLMVDTRPTMESVDSAEEIDKEKRATTLCRCPFKHTWEGNEKEKAQRCWTPNTAASSSTTTTKSVRIDDNPEVETVPARPEPAASQGGDQPPDIKEMLADVGKMLKQMTAANIKKATIVEAGFEQKLEEVQAAMRTSTTERGEEGQDGLLDSGASHAMRLAQGNEYENGSAVKVTLAGEDVREMKQNIHGTVLIENDGRNAVQPIVPLGAVIEELDCSLQWQKGSFQLRHPLRGLLKVKMVNNCPEIKAKDALSLIRELESKHLATLNHQVESLKARLEVLKKEETRTWDDILREYVKKGTQSLLLRAVLVCPFTKDLPEDVQAMVVEGFDVDQGMSYLKQLPLTRRRRKLLMTSNQWVVVLNQAAAENHDDPLSVVQKDGKVILEVDCGTSRLWDIHRKGIVYQLLLWAAARGKVTDILGSPPHSTWPTSMTPDRGPQSYPTRTTAFPYGHDALPPLKQQRLDCETAAAVKQMLLWMVATLSGKGNVGFLLEQPSDKERLRQDDPSMASLWKTELWKSFKSVSGMSLSSFYMGAMGHKGKRPTTVATNYARLCQLDGLYDFADNCVPRSLVDDKEMNTWSRGFKEIVAKAVSELHQCSMSEEEALDELGVKVSKLTKEQKEAWKRHLQQDHQPYRADCSICINARATGYQHRRRLHPSMFTVAIDLAGPFKQKGRDMEHEDFRYLMVAAYRCPKAYMSSKGITDSDAEMYVPDEEEISDEDPLALDDEVATKEDEHPISEDEEERPLQGPETLDDVAERLTQPEEAATVYITRPLRRRTAAHVLQATKEIMIQLKQTGLHVSGIHSDRAREFKAKPFKEWTIDAGLRHTKTAGGDPTGNSTAELGIKWAKSRMRALLKSAGAPPRDWPMAAAHASAALWGKLFPDSPYFHPPATTFGNEVWFRAKNYMGTKERKHEAAGTRWKKGYYKGPSMDVHRGHLISREDGGLTIAKSVKFDVKDVYGDKELRDLLPPAVAENVEDDGDKEEWAPSKAQLKEEIEFQSRMLREKGSYTIEDVLEIYYKLEKLGDTDRRVKKKMDVKSWFTGAFVHGGKAGPRSNVENFPQTSKLLVEFGKKFAKGKTFSAVGMARNAQLGLHRDLHNDPDSFNTVVPLTDFVEGNLWVQDDEVEEEMCVMKTNPSGDRIRGKILEIKKGEATFFQPRQWHEVQPWVGDRIVLLMFTPRTSKLTPEDVETLSEAGFVFPQVTGKEGERQHLPEIQEEERPLVNVKMLAMQGHPELPVTFDEIYDEDLLPGGECQPGTTGAPTHAEAIRNFAAAKLMKIVKKAEVQCTPDIEKVLAELAQENQPLQVTHTVSLQEVKRNLGAWKESAMKEFKNLVDSKNALKITKRHLLPPGCRIVPCKGVYTVKPDKGPLGYRRKTRFVACGNYVPENETTFDVYAAGLDATSLRTVLASSSTNPKWGWGVTDIRQAFVLARWLGGPVALQPPAIAFDLGLAEEGDMWEVQQAIYGLRESPAMWSQYRDAQLTVARWNVDVDGVPVTMKLEQMISDNQVWRIVREDGQGGPQGYLLVYIDDLLINAEENTMRSFFSWLSAKWEVDELDVLDYNHPIKFLGTELHKVPGGVEMAQEGFIKELLRAHGHKGTRSKIQGPKETMILSDEEERALIDAEPVDISGKEDIVKEAQRRVGELLWLMGRSRPDIQHAVSIMSSRITRCPELVNKVGVRILDYLCETIHYRLRFVPNDQKINHLDIYTDSSFAPSGGRSHGSSAVFFNDCAITWRSARQQLVTLSTAESELLEAVEGMVQGRATKGLLDELTNDKVIMNLLVDNAAAVTLLGSATGSWRTRHLRLRSNWLRELIQAKAVNLRHQPGDGQRADLGTKPFSRERLQQLVRLWGLVDTRPPSTSATATTKKVSMNPSWLSTLLMMCQVCGSAGQKEDLQTELPWDLYVAILVLSIAVIAVWEGGKSCLRPRGTNVKALRVQANASQRSRKMTRNELKELQRMLAIDPNDLTSTQKIRLVELQEKFNDTMPEGSSPMPRFPDEMFQASSSTASASSTTPPSSYNKQPKLKETKDAETQTSAPAFTRVEPSPPTAIRTYAGPFYQTPGGDRFHVFPHCWGLRNASRTNTVSVCRCCAENAGNRIY